MFSVLQHNIHDIFTIVPWEHWIIIGVLSLVVVILLLLWKRCSAYGSLSFGITVFVCLFLLETALVVRYCGLYPHGFGYTFGIDRLIHPSIYGWAELVSNVIVFIPFGFFLSEFLASAKRIRIGRRMVYVTLAGFGLSLCIECLQLALHLGYFELTDLILNTFGAFVGVVLSAIGRLIVKAL